MVLRHVDAGWDRGFEPDACFYLRNAASVRGLERLDPRVDPVPEVVFEVDAALAQLLSDGLVTSLPHWLAQVREWARSAQAG